jgi:hypothetical protein
MFLNGFLKLFSGPFLGLRVSSISTHYAEGMELDVKRRGVLSKVTPLKQLCGRILEVTDV